MKKRILLSVASIITTFTLIGSATLAYFSDSATNGPSVLKAGGITISANRDDGEAIPGPMFYFDNNTDGKAGDASGTPGTKQDGYWYPGKTSAIKVLEVHNGPGSTAVKLDKIDAIVTDPTPNNGVDDTIMKNALWVKIMSPSGQIRWEGYLSELTDGTPESFTTPFDMAALSVQFINFQASMPTELPGDDNIYQGKDIKVQFRVYATQR